MGCLGITGLAARGDKYLHSHPTLLCCCLTQLSWPYLTVPESVPWPDLIPDSDPIIAPVPDLLSALEPVPESVPVPNLIPDLVPSLMPDPGPKLDSELVPESSPEPSSNPVHGPEPRSGSSMSTIFVKGSIISVHMSSFDCTDSSVHVPTGMQPVSVALLS